MDTRDEARLDHLLQQRFRESALSRRRFFHLLAAGAGAGAAVVGPAGGQRRSLAATSRQEAARQGGELVIGEYFEPDSLDPHRTPSRHMWIVGWALYDPLVIANDQGEIFPNLAREWTIAEDGLTYTFSLRDDVVFHDGTPFNAEAVKYNYDRVVDPATGSLLSNDDIGPYESSTVVDEFSVEIKLSRPYGPLLRMLSLQEFGIISPTAAEEFGLDDFGRNPVGTGPFKFVEWVPQSQITVEANPDYAWASPDIYEHDGPPHLDRLVYQYIVEDQARIAALETGECQAILRVPPRDVARLEADDQFQVRSWAALGHPTAYVINTDQAPTNDLAVRRALAMGLNRAQITASLYADQNTPAYGPLSPATFSYWQGCEEANAFDLDAARQALDEAGWSEGDEGVRAKDGQSLDLELFAFPGTEDVAVAVQGSLRELGVNVNVNQAPWAEQKAIAFEGRHHLIVVTFGAPDPRILRLLYHSENFREGGWCWTHLPNSDPDLQAQLDEALDRGEVVTNPEERAAAYEQAQQIIVENALVLPVKNDFQIVGLRATVQGWKMDDQNYHPRPYDVWLEAD